MEECNASYFSRKKQRVMFILSIFVFFIHMPSLGNYNLTSTSGEVITTIHYASTVFAQVAVPLFFVISGVLFYRNYTLSLTINKYKSRFFSVMIPYVVWNIVWTGYYYLCSYTFVSQYFGRETAEFGVGDVLQGTLLYKYNPVFWFVFSLICFAVVCPVIYYLLRNQKIGVAVIVLLLILHMNGIGLPETLFFRGDSIIYYLFGAYIGMHGWDVFKKRMPRKTSIVLWAVCVLMCIIIWVKDKSFDGMMPLVYVVFLICFWYAMDFFEYNKRYRLERYSFLVYAIHLNVASAIAKVIYVVLPRNEFFCCINCVVTFVATLTFVYWFGRFCDRFPKIGRIFTGNR